MKFIIFGCGSSGQMALFFLSPSRVSCFSDSYKYGMVLYEKPVISYKEMVELCDKDKHAIVVIASEKYYKEMEEQICRDGIERYFIFHESDINLINNAVPYYFLYRKPVNLSYTQILAHWQIEQYRRIAIYGVNPFLPYLIAEIMEQAIDVEICIVPQMGYEERIYSLGYPVVGLEELKKEVCKWDCMLINVKRGDDNIRDDEFDFYHRINVVDIYDISSIEPVFYHYELQKYKDIHKGKRIFVIGNGPSLKISDLDKLWEQGEICIAFNKIYKVYDKTRWRANYVGFSDDRVIRACKDDIPKLPGEVFVVDRFHTGVNERLEGIQYYHELLEEYYPNYPGFSDDFARGVYDGMTVVYNIGLQLAAYMGASKIYLLGVDNSIKGNVTDSCNHFCPDYYSEEEKAIYEGERFEREKIVKGYEKAEVYSRKNGFRIFNATRGGELEVFERVAFDSLF